MNRNFMKLAFVSALAFAGTLSVNAQMTAPGWAQEQNATVQTLAQGLQDGQNFVVSETDRVIVYKVISKNTTTDEDYEYFVSVVGITKTACDAGVTEVVIPFSVTNGTITAKIEDIKSFDVIDDVADPAKLETKVTGVSLAGITKLTVGISGTEDHLSPFSTGITSISDNAFANLTGLTEIITYNTTPATMTAAAFPTALYSSAKLSVAPSTNGTVAGKHATAAGWEKFKRLYTVGDTYCFGDFNSDSFPNASDVTQLSKYVAARNKTTFINNAGYTVNTHTIDTNGDGYVNASDVTTISKMISGRKRAK